MRKTEGRQKSVSNEDQHDWKDDGWKQSALNLSPLALLAVHYLVGHFRVSARRSISWIASKTPLKWSTILTEVQPSWNNGCTQGQMYSCLFNLHSRFTWPQSDMFLRGCLNLKKKIEHLKNLFVAVACVWMHCSIVLWI